MASLSERRDRDEAFRFWKDPSNKDSIYNAIPLEQMSYKQHLLDHFEASPAEIDEWILSTKPPATKNIASSRSLTGKFGASKILPTEDLAEDLSAHPSDESTVTFSPSVDPTGDNYDSTYRPSCGLTIVERDSLQRYPYKCVGRLFWFKPSESNNIVHSTTAFYIGDNKIITVAHAFDLPMKELKKGGNNKPPFPGRSLKEAIFVPAMRDRHDIYGQFYGYYHISKLYVPKNYEPREFERSYCINWDIAIAEITPGDESDINQKLGYAYIPWQNFEHSIEPLKIIGYAKYQDNEDRKMCELDVHITSNNTYSVEVQPGAAAGMSGGPWLLHDLDKAIGVQSGSHFTDSYVDSQRVKQSITSISPKFTNNTVGPCAGRDSYYSYNPSP